VRGGVIVADVSDGTAAGLVAFLEWAGSRGEINPSTASSRAVAVRRVMEIEGASLESIDLRQVNVDELLDRFETLKRLEYTSESMKVYRSRVRTAIESYLAWLDKRPDWKNVGRSSASPAKDRSTSSKQRGAARKPVQVAAPSSATSDIEGGQLSPGADSDPASLTPMIPYEVPLRSGGQLRARLVLPADLSRVDADRLCRFISSLAFEPPGMAPRGDAPVSNNTRLEEA
jgi:hypothetical protein